MAILSFLSNAAIENAIAGAVDCSGSGPTRLVEMANTWRVVVVSADEILGTAVEFPKGMNDDDRASAVAEIEWNAE